MGISFLGAESKAFSNEHLYLFCKPWADSGFTAQQTAQQISCVAYVAGVLDITDYLCELGNLTNNSSLKGMTTFEAKSQVNAVVQSYVNTMAARPERWKYAAAPSLQAVAVNLAPCISSN